MPKSRYITFLLLAVGGLFADLATKSWIFAWRGMPGEQPTYWLLKDRFGFTTSLNEGALFGVGQGQVILFTVLSIGATCWIVYWLFFKRAAQDALITVSMGCVLAGVLGNLYDRLGLPALRWNYTDQLHTHNVGEAVFAVRDWLHFRIPIIERDWPIFNIADSLLVCGAALMLWHAWRGERTGTTEVADQAVESGKLPPTAPSKQPLSGKA